MSGVRSQDYILLVHPWVPSNRYSYVSANYILELLATREYVLLVATTMSIVIVAFDIDTTTNVLQKICVSC
jgi:hypothetical protein